MLSFPYLGTILYTSRFIHADLAHKVFYACSIILLSQLAIHASYDCWGNYTLLATAGLRLALACIYTYNVLTKRTTRWICVYYSSLNTFNAVLLVAAIALPEDKRVGMVIALIVMDVIFQMLFAYCVSPTAVFVHNVDHMLSRLSSVAISIMACSTLLIIFVLPPFIAPLFPSMALPNVQENKLPIDVLQHMSGTNRVIQTDNALHLTPLYSFVALTILLLYLLNLIYNSIDVNATEHHAVSRSLELGTLWLYTQLMITSCVALIGVSGYFLSQCILADLITPVPIAEKPEATVYNTNDNTIDYFTLATYSVCGFSFGVSFALLSMLVSRQFHTRADHEMIRCIDCSLSQFHCLPVHTYLTLLHYSVELYQIIGFAACLSCYFLFTNQWLNPIEAGYYLLYLYVSVYAGLAVLYNWRSAVISALSRRHESHEFSLDTDSLLHTHMLSHSRGPGSAATSNLYNYAKLPSDSPRRTQHIIPGQHRQTASASNGSSTHHTERDPLVRHHHHHSSNGHNAPMNTDVDTKEAYTAPQASNTNLNENDLFDQLQRALLAGRTSHQGSPAPSKYGTMRFK